MALTGGGLRMNSVEFYNLWGNKTSNWIGCARQLLISSEVLMRFHDEGFEEGKNPNIHFEVFAPSLMLKAFGIECLLKAVWIARGNKITEAGKYKPIVKNEGHDLVKLCAAIKIELSTDEKDILSVLTVAGRNGGRFPIAKKHDENKPAKGSAVFSIVWNGQSDEVILNGLISRLIKEIEDKSSKKS